MFSVDVFLAPESQARLEALLASFAPGGSKARAILEGGVRALNHAAYSGRRVAVRAIAQDFGIKDSDVRPYVGVRPATADRPSAVLYAFDRKKTRGIPLINLGVTGPEPSRGKGGGVTSRAGTLPHAFIATVGRGHRGVFQRSGRQRLPIREQFTPSVRQAFGRHRGETIAHASAVLHADIETEIAHALQGA
jgi:hypothetical protein